MTKKKSRKRKRRSIRRPYRGKLRTWHSKYKQFTYSALPDKKPRRHHLVVTVHVSKYRNQRGKIIDLLVYLGLTTYKQAVAKANNQFFIEKEVAQSLRDYDDWEILGYKGIVARVSDNWLKARRNYNYFRAERRRSRIRRRDKKVTFKYLRRVQTEFGKAKSNWDRIRREEITYASRTYRKNRQQSVLAKYTPAES